MLDKNFFSCTLAELPEFQPWLNAPQTLEILVQSPEQGEQTFDDFVSRLVLLVANGLPTNYNRNQEASPSFKRLQQKGYSNAMIAEAFTYSWLAGVEQLYLPRFKSNLANNSWVKYTPPVILTIILLIELISFAVTVYGGSAITLIYGFPPVVVVPAIPIYLLIYQVWRKCVPYFFKAGGVRNPDAVHPLADKAGSALITLQQARANSLPATSTNALAAEKTRTTIRRRRQQPA